MESKLRELVGKSNVWLFVKSGNGWLKNVEILDVNSDTVTFRYQQESESDLKLWEKTTRLDNIADIEVRLLEMPKTSSEIKKIKDSFSKLLETEYSDEG
ncbi:MAG: DUF6679 family protein [Cyanobacteria bacterium P01_A01_bin.84]